MRAEFTPRPNAWTAAPPRIEKGGRASGREAIRAPRDPREARASRPVWTTSETFDEGEALFAAVCELGLEGMVAKNDERSGMVSRAERSKTFGQLLGGSRLATLSMPVTERATKDYRTLARPVQGEDWK